MEKPRFSVIIPTLNEEKFLPKLLASLGSQRERDFEVIVVDGRSRDRTVAVAQAARSKLPALKIEIAPKASLPLQRNLGAQKARGQWLIFVDADSVLLPYFFERIAEFIAKEKPKIFTTWFRPDSETTGDALITLLTNISLESSIILKRPHAPGPLTVVEAQLFAQIGGYDQSREWLEDLDFSLRAYRRGFPLQILRETLCIWSLRRFRKQGTLRVLQTYAKGVFSALLRRIPREMPGYMMGGQLYNEMRRPFSRQHLKSYQGKLRRLVKRLLV